MDGDPPDNQQKTADPVCKPIPKCHTFHEVGVMDGRPLLIDVRQIEPDKERDISGACSACGAILLARLRKDTENPYWSASVLNLDRFSSDT